MYFFKELSKALNAFQLSRLISVFVGLLIVSPNASAQWTNHYPKLNDFGHHVYLEQHELPILAHGITDPAPSPDGRHIAIASKGWLWLLEIESGIAVRITNSASVDSRPRWSPDGEQIAFVRDYGKDTGIIILHLASGEETSINSPAIDLDPEFSSDGRYLYYTSGISGSLNLYQRTLKSNDDQALTALNQVERNVRRLADQQGFVYLHGSGAHRVLRYRDTLAGTDQIIHAETLAYHLSSDVHPTRNLLTFSAPIDNDYHLWTMDMADNRVANRITEAGSFALTPAFSADGNHIFFVSLTNNRQFQLMQMPTYGGKPKPINVTKWDYGRETGTLTIKVTDDKLNPIAARVSIKHIDGHPVSAIDSATFVDPQTGRSYFYIDNQTTLTLPHGKYQIEAVRGPMTSVYATVVNVNKSQSNDVTIKLAQLWDSTVAGYASADFHVHLNGDGHHRAAHDDALLMIKGENLNALSPMSWNRWERRIDSAIVGKRSTQDNYQVIQGQEVRSHFHGHIGLLNLTEPFTPWFFGPNNPALGDTDLTNGDVFAYANKVGAFATYVHPIGDDGDPFSDALIDNIPLELVSDGVIEERMGLELVCAWTSPIGNMRLWYRFLNIGQPVSAMSGTDGWVDFHRTPAVGTGRAYIRSLPGDYSAESLLANAIAGRSFVTTGPMLTFRLDNGAQPGDITDSGEQAYSLTVLSTSALEVVEIIVNGDVVETLEGVKAGKLKNYKGKLTLPNGGWIAARAYAKEQRLDSWPTMHARPFAHSSPIWIEQIGSTTPEARDSAAADLMRAIESAEKQARQAYGERPMPKLYQRFEKARQKLSDIQ